MTWKIQDDDSRKMTTMAEGFTADEAITEAEEKWTTISNHPDTIAAPLAPDFAIMWRRALQEMITTAIATSEEGEGITTRGIILTKATVTAPLMSITTLPITNSRVTATKSTTESERAAVGIITFTTNDGQSCQSLPRSVQPVV